MASSNITTVRIKVPMPTGTPEGDYVVGVSGLDAQGEIIGKTSYQDSEDIDYFHHTPTQSADVPDTGFFSGTLSIAKSDILITSLIVFFVAVIYGLFILNKKKTN